MSLDWDISKCADRKALTDTDEAYGLTKAIVFETMVLDIGEITAKTVDEFILRSNFWRTMMGEALIPAEAIRRRIGLSTNVFPMRTRNQFIKKVSDNWFHEATRRVREAAKTVAINEAVHGHA